MFRDNIFGKMLKIKVEERFQSYKNGQRFFLPEVFQMRYKIKNFPVSSKNYMQLLELWFDLATKNAFFILIKMWETFLQKEIIKRYCA